MGLQLFAVTREHAQTHTTYTEGGTSSSSAPAVPASRCIERKPAKTPSVWLPSSVDGEQNMQQTPGGGRKGDGPHLADQLLLAIGAVHPARYHVDWLGEEAGWGAVYGSGS